MKASQIFSFLFHANLTHVVLLKLGFGYITLKNQCFEVWFPAYGTLGHGRNFKMGFWVAYLVTRNEIRKGTWDTTDTFLHFILLPVHKVIFLCHLLSAIIICFPTAIGPPNPGLEVLKQWPKTNVLTLRGIHSDKTWLVQSSFLLFMNFLGIFL